MNSVAYKYEAGLEWLSVQPASGVSLARYGEHLAGTTAWLAHPPRGPVPLKASNRLVIAEAAKDRSRPSAAGTTSFWSA